MTEARVEQLLEVQVAARPDALAPEDATGAAWSWADPDAAARALDAEIGNQGVRPGDRVLILIENCAAAVVALFACWRVGAVPVPVNARQSGPKIDRIAAHACPRLLLFIADVSPDAARHAARCGASTIEGIWGRQLRKLGHDVKLMPACQVTPCVKRGKKDAIDGEAICEA